ncbi:glycosyl hydrolase [Namhaeicola litoreus]|uniref:Glycosyl hydrolase n=1 Tax=Namhaeicola litoreus TaxID=1052145 RepID=A0ABW3Y5J8_9FLAO
MSIIILIIEKAKTNTIRSFRFFLYLLLFCSFGLLSSCEEKGNLPSDLEQGFKNPPQNSKPKTWMHAMSGNMTKEGLTKDLESMAEVGLGGLLLFNITQGIPNGPIKYNSVEHHEMISHAAHEAERLGLTFGVHNCDGWSASGGPWVSAEESMKMVVWSEIQVQGGKKIELQLLEPSKRENFYRDIAVLAYPSLGAEIDDAKNKVEISASDVNLNINIISDGKIDNETTISKVGEINPWIQYSFEEQKDIRSVKIIFNDRHATAILQTSEDGKNFKDIRELFKVRTGKGEWAINDHFEAIGSKYFRLQFNQQTTIKEVQLSSVFTINNALGRTAIARTEDHALAPIGMTDNSMIINPDEIKLLNEDIDNNGVLRTNLPQGNWTILRFGYTSTGAFNNPSSDEGRGLEVDKLSRTAFKNHYDAFVKKVVNNTSSSALKYAEIDSYEMGGQNWTEDFDSIFKSRKGYDFIPFLPLVAGKFVESTEASDAILSDFRKVISDLMTENYFEYFTELCNADGLQSYIEPYGFGPLNDLDIGGVTDIPMGEFWMNRPITQTASAVSSAHIYGKPIISAESFTSTPEINWKGHPAMAKTSGDLAWTYGINEFMFHRFAHQANTQVEPGMTMNRWGFHFDRTQTWWKNAGAAWFQYIARGSFMLRQGNPVSDVLVYIGEGAPNGSYYRNDIEPEVPKTINFDNVNTDVLLNRLQLKGDGLLLPEGTNYKMLLLKNTKKLSLLTVQRIYDIAKSGFPVYGEVPQNLAGYQNSEQDKKAFLVVQKKLAPLVKPVSDWNTVLLECGIIPDLLVNKDEAIDFTHRKTENEDIYFFFNADTSATKIFDISFRVPNKIPELWNPINGMITRKADFVHHKNGSTQTSITLAPQESTFVVFREESKGIESVTKPNIDIHFSFSKGDDLKARIYKNGNYNISLSSGKSWDLSVSDLPEHFEIEGSWDVTFKKENGYGGSIKMDSLVDWKDYPKDSINFYSGTATYVKTITIPQELLKTDIKAVLDLGKVYIVANVWLNNKQVAISWMHPFELDISEYLVSGENTLKIELTNQWSNRLIGDERYPPNDGNYKIEGYRPEGKMPDWYVNNEPRPSGKRTTFTTAPFYKQDSPLMPSGLLGPVEIKFSKEVIYSNKNK